MPPQECEKDHSPPKMSGNEWRIINAKILNLAILKFMCMGINRVIVGSNFLLFWVAILLCFLCFAYMYLCPLPFKLSTIMHKIFMYIKQPELKGLFKS